MKKVKIIFSALAFVIGVGSAYMSVADDLLVYAGYRSTSTTGSTCQTFSNIPDDCLTTNPGAQCTVSISGVTNYLFASVNANNVCIQPVKRP